MFFLVSNCFVLVPFHNKVFNDLPALKRPFLLQFTQIDYKLSQPASLAARVSVTLNFFLLPLCLVFLIFSDSLLYRHSHLKSKKFFPYAKGT